MSDKTEEQIAADKAALDAMRNARAHMDTALRRASDLEDALRRSIEALKTAKSYISPNVYRYPAASQNRTCHEWLDEAVATAQKALG